MAQPLPWVKGRQEEGNLLRKLEILPAMAFGALEGGCPIGAVVLNPGLPLVDEGA